MGLLVECPECKKRNSAKAKGRKCGFALSKHSGRVYWIEWYNLAGRRRRKRIGPSKTAAEQELRRVQTAKAEGRHIQKSLDASTRFSALAKWYLELSEVKAKRSYDKDQMHCRRLIAYFGGRLLKEITPAMVEAYKQQRLSEPSGRSPNNLTTPATVNRELACLKTIFNKAMKNGMAERNPIRGVKLLKENNERDRILSPEEYLRLLEQCSNHLKPIVKLAYNTGMRQGVILNLTWGHVDLKGNFIHLDPEDTKINEGRLIPLNEELVEMFKAMVRGLPGVRVFTFKGNPINSIKVGFVKACKRAGIEDFTFHDLRHTFNTNAFRAGVPIPTIMKITGHKSLSMFKRYTTITAEDLLAAVQKM